MNTKMFLVAALCFVMSILNGQRELESYQFNGKIILNDGTEKIGVIEMNGSKHSPWANQTEVKYISPEVFAQEKIKNKDKEKFEPGDIKGFWAGDRYFESQKYADMSEVSMSMMPKWYFLETQTTGKISVYTFYKTPPKVAVGEAEMAEMKRKTEEYRENPFTLIYKEDMKQPVDITSCDIYKYISDCEVVLNKYKAGEYGIDPVDNDDKGTVGKFVAKAVDASKLSEYIVPICKDYNNCSDL